MKIISVVGARPNFMKIAPLLREFEVYKEIKSILVHTGQHYDNKMSDSFFNELQIKKPDINLNVGSASHAVQTAQIMQKFEVVLIKEKPDYVIVVGDVNSTLACTITAKKLNIKVVHIESGLRSFDRTMPEEINRIVTDSISDILFTTCDDGTDNLLKEGVDKKRVFMVGNSMIDTLAFELKRLECEGVIKEPDYAVLTLHRPSNVDSKKSLQTLLEVFNEISKKIDIKFPVHPRTLNQINKFKLNKIISPDIELLPPLSYLNFLKLYKNSRLVLTDSGGIQEETSYLNIPCITLRDNTERPVTISEGTNFLVGTSRLRILRAFNSIMKSSEKTCKKIRYWDGKTSERITKILLKTYKKNKSI